MVNQSCQLFSHQVCKFRCIPLNDLPNCGPGKQMQIPFCLCPRVNPLHLLKHRLHISRTSERLTLKTTGPWPARLMPTLEGPLSHSRLYRCKASCVRRVEQVRPQPPSRQLKIPQSSRRLALTPMPARGSFKRVRRTRLWGGEAEGAQECGTPTGARGRSAAGRPPSASRQGRPTPTSQVPTPGSEGPPACNAGAPPRRQPDAPRAAQLGARPRPHLPSARRVSAAGNAVARRGSSAFRGQRRGGRREADKGCSAAGRTVPDSSPPAALVVRA